MTRWQLQAECRFEDPEMFYPTGHGQYSTVLEAEAKDVCRRCPVRAECLEFAYAIQDQHAVMGGLTPDERTAARRNANRQSRRDAERAVAQVAHLAAQLEEAS